MKSKKKKTKVSFKVNFEYYYNIYYGVIETYTRYFGIHDEKHTSVHITFI